MQKFWAIILSAIPSQSVRDEILQSSVRQQRLTTDRRKWVTMQHRSFTAVCRRISQKVMMMTIKPETTYLHFCI